MFVFRRKAYFDIHVLVILVLNSVFKNSHCHELCHLLADTPNGNEVDEQL